MAQLDARVIIYVPGLGHDDGNTGDRIADVLARAYDRRDGHQQYSTTTDAEVTAPRGLKVAKSIVSNDAKRTVIQVFELDYQTKLDKPSGPAGPPVSPGVVQSTQYAVFAAIKLAWAWRRPAKTWRSKSQLMLGFLAAAALLFLWFVTVYSALVAVGVKLPHFLGALFSDKAAGWSFGGFAGLSVLSWAAVRKSVLAGATTIEHLIDYVRNADRTAGTVCLTLDDAVAGLIDAGWTGPIHLLGYSFGSLILFDSAFPPTTWHKIGEPLDAISSLVTIGCPLDLVRLYFPKYADTRAARAPGVEWRNIYNAADIFASNLKEKEEEDEPTAVTATAFQPFNPKSIRYLNERLTPLQLFMMKGFRTHAGYWGDDDEGQCFEETLELWMPKPTVQPSAGPAAVGGVP